MPVGGLIKFEKLLNRTQYKKYSIYMRNNKQQNTVYL